MKRPTKFISISSDFLQIPKFMFLSVMPEHSFAED